MLNDKAIIEIMEDKKGKKVIDRYCLYHTRRCKHEKTNNCNECRILTGNEKLPILFEGF